MIPGMSVSIALYFFLAGMGAGTYICERILLPFGPMEGPQRGSSSAKALAWILPPLLVGLGSAFLFFHLGVPSHALLVLLRPLESTISFGAWSLIFFVLSDFAFLWSALHLSQRHWLLLRFLDGLTFVAACSVAAYTGVYLFRMNSIALWHTLSVVVLFVASALSCGIAALTGVVFFGQPGERRALPRLSRAANLVAIVELVSLSWFCVRGFLAGQDASVLAHELVCGGHAISFWLLVVCIGMLVPWVCRSIAGHGYPRTWQLVAVCGTLVGGLALRSTIIFL